MRTMIRARSEGRRFKGEEAAGSGRTRAGYRAVLSVGGGGCEGEGEGARDRFAIRSEGLASVSSSRWASSVGP